MAVKKPTAPKSSSRSRREEVTGTARSHDSRSKSRRPKSQKTGAASQAVKRKSRPVRTAQELGIPRLNMVTPAGVQRPRGKKKDKVYVDDAESMATIIAMVNADKEGQIESKMMKARHMEELREARRKEALKKEELRKSKLDEAKDDIKKRKKNSTRPTKSSSTQEAALQKSAKRVSFK